MKVRYLFILAVVAAVSAVVGLRWNQQRVAELRQAVIAADEANGDVESALTGLHRFVVSHMNTSVRVELVASYERAVARAQSGFAAETDEELLAQAQAACDQPGVSSVEQAECVRQFLESRRTPGTNPQPLEPPDKSLFIHTFVAPIWSPDLAGFSLLVAAIAAIASLGLFIKHTIAARRRSEQIHIGVSGSELKQR